MDRLTFLTELQKHKFKINEKEYDPEKKRKRTKEQISLPNKIKIALDETFEQVNSPDGFKISLYPHQQTALAALLEVEKTRVLNFPDAKIAYNAAVYSDPPGIGKTITALALIKLSKIPRLLPSTILLPGSVKNFINPCVRVKYKVILTPTFIYAGSSVLRQWEQTIDDFTDMTYFSVNNINDLRLLLRLMFESYNDEKTGINKYDIVLVKNGTVSRHIGELPGGIKLNSANTTSHAHIHNLIVNLGMAVARNVYDDFDTIKLPRDAYIGHAVFTWFISSTRKCSSLNGNIKIEKGYNTAESMRGIRYDCDRIVRNKILFQFLNVRNSIEYINQTAHQTVIKYSLIKNKNNAALIVNLLGGLNGGDEKFMEMLNGDAFNEAAKKLGYSKRPVADLFLAILGEKYKDFRKAIDMKKRATQLLEVIDLLPTVESNVEQYSKSRFMEGDIPQYNYPGLKAMLETTCDQADDLKKQSGIAIQRVQDNIREGECIICFKGFAVDGLVINKCCGSALCNECGYVMQQLTDRFNKKGVCAKCRASIDINDLICIGNNFNLESILSDKLDESESENESEVDEKTEEVEVLDEKTTFDETYMVPPFNNDKTKSLEEWAKYIKEYEEKTKEVARDKYLKLVDIIFGLAVSDSTRIDVNISNITQGACYKPESKVRKVLIFANYSETLSQVRTILSDNGIVYWHLQGGPSMISNIARSFTHCSQPCALVINSTHHCSGLNLQTATDIVFMHKINDNNVETQVIGRGHRLGRTAPLNVWFNLYSGEAAEFKSRYKIRVMSDSELKEESAYESGAKIHSINNLESFSQEDDDKKKKPKSSEKKKVSKKKRSATPEPESEPEIEYESAKNSDYETSSEDEIIYKRSKKYAVSVNKNPIYLNNLAESDMDDDSGCSNGDANEDANRHRNVVVVEDTDEDECDDANRNSNEEEVVTDDEDLAKAIANSLL